MSVQRYGPPPPDLKPYLFASIGGMTGTGKTWTAMLLMDGLCGGKRWGLADTEGGRGAAYHKDRLGDKGFDFDYSSLDAPYTQEKYERAIDDAKAQGLAGLIIDSGSHAWDGDGGVLDQASAGVSGDNVPFHKWKAPKIKLWRLFEKAKQADMHVIICLRAKPKKKMVKVQTRDGSKDEVVDTGTLPIMDSSIWHEFDFLAVLDPEAPGVPKWTAKALSIQYHDVFKAGVQITREHGRKLAAIHHGQAAASTTTDAPAGQTSSGAQSAGEKLLQRAEEVAAEGYSRWQSWQQQLKPAQIDFLKPHLERLNKMAIDADTASLAEDEGVEDQAPPIDDDPGAQADADTQGELV